MTHNELEENLKVLKLEIYQYIARHPKDKSLHHILLAIADLLQAFYEKA